MSAPTTLSEALQDGWGDESVYGSAEIDSQRELDELRLRRIPLRRKDGSVIAHAIVDVDDYERIAQFRWFKEVKGYARRTINHGTNGPWEAVWMHRVVLGLQTDDRRQVDHINGDKLDNRSANLRPVSNAENQQNLHRLRSTNRSGFRGVYRNTGRWGKPWYAQASVDGVKHFLGAFDTPEEADAAARAFRAEHMPFSQDAFKKRASAGATASPTTRKANS